jgi:polar amino acid transport system substrate-binding protein
MQIRLPGVLRGTAPGLSFFLLALCAFAFLGLGGCQSVGLGAAVPAPDAQDSVHRIVRSGKLRVGMSGVQPPLNMKNHEGQLIGLDVDLATALSDAMDLELVLVERPFSELLEGLEQGDYDLVISMLTITPARNARVAFAGPYMISGATLLTRAAQVEEFNRLEALDSNERAWGALAGSTSEALIKEAFPNARLVATDDLDVLVPQIADGTIDGLISDLPYVRYQVARNPEAGLAVLPTPFTTEPLGIALTANSPLLANLVQNYLNTLEYTGQLIQMKAHWLNEGEWLSEIP